ncbi:MAG: internal scaffolding protein [Microvirus sp.]|nr:MAG: internal scaffolding protein [Microvirus sp.]
MTKIIVLNPFTLDLDVHSNLHSTTFDDVSLTSQNDVQQSDINYIVKQFGLTHELPYGRSIPEYADYTDIPNDYHAARQYIDELNDAFMAYPAEIRSRFENNPANLLDFLNDNNNRDEALQLGFITEPEMKAEGENQVQASPKDATGTVLT